MTHSSLEITEQEYLIKLPRDHFDLGFIYQLIKRIQTEQLFLHYTDHEPEEDIISRNSFSDQESRFDNLSDK
jgi:hypothetical protein